MMPPADHPAPLSVTRAFVVQFRADTTVVQGYLAGRVEHVVSGQATDFETLETLLAFIARVLRAERVQVSQSIIYKGIVVYLCGCNAWRMSHSARHNTAPLGSSMS